jgi:hypothetical protein
LGQKLIASGAYLSLPGACEVKAEGKHVLIAKAQIHRPQGEQAVSEQGRQRHHQRSP